jgi:ribonuclease VapC
LIVVDSSALIAIMFEEPERDGLVDRLEISARAQRYLSAANYLETGAVVAARIAEPLNSERDLDALLSMLGIRVVPLTEDQARIGLQARIRYGRGFGSPAKLNLGDCHAYALAKDLNAPLLFIGNDFTNTDIRSAL